MIASALISWAAPKAIDAAQEVVSNVVDSMQGGDAYRYTFEVQTSCNDGAATDGGVDVKITDYKGASFRTGYLDIEGEDDRELCSLDTYETEGVDGKVLLRSDTECKVYFNPAGDNPKWEPEYIKVKRSSDSSDTKSAKFCSNNGVLGEEGWYVFDYCS